MAERMNAAKRAYELLTKAHAIADEKKKTAEVWATVFGIEFKPTPAGFGEVARMLALLSEELEEAFRQMEASDYSRDLYHATFNKARTAMGLAALNGNWKNLRQKLDGETLTILKFCSEVLPDEELRIPEGAFEAIVEILDTLRAAVAGEDMPEDLRIFIESQVTIIERALREFPIIGEKAFDRAVGEVLVTYPEYATVIEAYKGRKEIGLLDKAWNQILKWSARLGALQNLLSSGEGIIGLLGSGE